MHMLFIPTRFHKALNYDNLYNNVLIKEISSQSRYILKRQLNLLEYNIPVRRMVHVY